MSASRWMLPALCLLVGLSIGMNASGLWPQIPVHALATHGQDNFAIATGPVSDDIEAVYMLDYLTGDLKAAVLNLQTGKFMSFFESNIAGEMATSGTKNPKYLMVTGRAVMRRGNVGQLGTGVVYVTDYATGQVAAYGLPWTAGREQTQVQNHGHFIPLDIAKFRATNVH